MNSDYSHNPLTEVALALSMAFFAIMVLTIFALSQKQFKSIESDKISMPGNTEVRKKSGKTIFVDTISLNDFIIAFLRNFLINLFGIHFLGMAI